MDPLPLLDELTVIARNGRHFADDPYDEERYERILELVEEYYGEALELPKGDVKECLRQRLGYVLSAGAAVFDDEGRILLMKRADNGTWCLPGGMVEPHETPEQAAIREVKEETRQDVRLIGTSQVNYFGPDEGYPHRHVHFIYHAEVTGGNLRLSAEGTALDYREIEAVPEWHPNHEGYALRARREWAERSQ